MTKMTLNNDILSRLTGAPKQALDKRGGIEYYKNNKSKSNNQDVYLEGIIVGNEDPWLSGFEGFISPSQMREKLDATEGDINLFVDSVGGSVWGASNMLTQIIKLRKEGRRVNVVVTGLCASAATYFLFEADSTAIAPLGEVMVHRAWSCGCGDSENFEKLAALLKKTDTQYVQQLADLTGQKMSAVEDAVKQETWFLGQEALDWGLVDEMYTTNQNDPDPEPDTKQNKFRLLVSQLSDFNF